MNVRRASGYADHVEMTHRRRVLFSGVCMILVALMCAGLLTAAVLVPAPHAVLPLVILTSIVCPMGAAFELAQAVAAVREPRLQLRRELDRLPETPHPLGF
jgi:hypothetical protein